jgi:hypothetical protein
VTTTFGEGVHSPLGRKNGIAEHGAAATLVTVAALLLTEPNTA